MKSQRNTDPELIEFRRRMLALGLDAGALAVKTGIHKPTLQNVLSGAPSQEARAKIAAALELSPHPTRASVRVMKQIRRVVKKIGELEATHQL